MDPSSAEMDIYNWTTLAKLKTVKTCIDTHYAYWFKAMYIYYSERAGALFQCAITITIFHSNIRYVFSSAFGLEGSS